MVYQTAPFSMTLNDPKPRFQSQALTLNISVMVNPRIALLFLRTPVALGCKNIPIRRLCIRTTNMLDFKSQPGVFDHGELKENAPK